MELAKQALIERECARLVTAYTHLIDFGNAAHVADLFTDDGTWESPESVLRGRDEIRKSFQARQDNTLRASRHVCTNLLVEVLDEAHAGGVVYFSLYRHDGDTHGRAAPLNGPLVVGQYRDRFVCTADGWFFASRKAEVAFVRRDSTR